MEKGKEQKDSKQPFFVWWTRTHSRIQINTHTAYETHEATESESLKD